MLEIFVQRMGTKRKQISKTVRDSPLAVQAAKCDMIMAFQLLLN
jgi:hypothetical protein